MKKPNPYADAPRLPDGVQICLDALLPGPGPCEIEIGPGRGAFLLARAASSPDRRLLGLEIRRKWASTVDERLRRQGCGERSRVLCSDARIDLPRLGPDGALAAVFLHFPDPWWKKRHQKRQVMSPALLAHICRLLADGGELFVQTDVAERAERYEALLGACPDLAPAGDKPGSARLAASPYGARSNRERRCVEEGVPIYRLRFRRRPQAGS
ncbi:MAG: tRNA (guanine-N7)-methyltransferase [Deltaproteobacteria bacterium]|nr:tRNA (guanine-N7)-methyltransferase [Deltaproteobacteria bacterium]